MVENIAVIGSSGALGNAFTEQLAALHSSAVIHAFSRQPRASVDNIRGHAIDYAREDSIGKAAALAAQQAPLDIVIVATGILHDGTLTPEKSLRELSAQKFQRLFAGNTILPALVAKYFLPHLNRHSRSIFAALSARVGSVSDNRLGGWYAYRASKAALNMVIKNAAIETARRNKQAIVVGLHPGTVDSSLSQPFQANVPADSLFTPEFSAAKLLAVLADLKPQHNGACLAWDSSEVPP